MNRKHVSKVGKYIGMACLLFVCAMVQSCRDEYFYDDKEPDFLGASIYDYLKEQGNFTLFLRVIDDLGETEMLSKTGSKTLFVADDDAFKAAFPKLGVEKYEDLSRAQKRMILYNAMLDNAYLLEMLSKWPSTDGFAEPTSGRCLRLATSSNVTDTIGYFYDKDLPQFNTAWDAFREGGIRLALDATATTMVFFTGDYLYQSNISNSDLGFIVNNSVSSSDIYVFDKKVLLDKSNVTCKNGYVHQLDGLLVAPSNMAEEIRTNGSTNVFSHLLDRFAVPVPISANSTVAQTYNRIYHPNEEGEQLYEKRYYTEGSDRGTAKEDGGFLSYENVDKVQQEAEEGGSLYYDPGWNAYQAGTSGTPKEQDMAAIFAPNDDAMLYYFTEGQGKDFIKKYAKIDDPKTITDFAALTSAIDSIPVNTLADIVRLHMQISFKSSVPSKFGNLLNDARDSLGVTQNAVKKSLLANNGIVYVVDEVYSPARYNAVTGPIKLHDSLYITNWAVEEYDYDKYLLSMKNQFGVVAPFDTAMIFYDPKTAKGEESRYAYRFVRQSDNTITIEKWNAYVPSTGLYGPLVTKLGSVAAANKQTLFKEMLEYYIIPEDMRDVNDSIAGRKYYRTKGYGTIKVGRDENGEIAALAGGKECQEGTMIPLAEKPVKKDNGMVFYLNSGMIHPATQSVYDVLSNTDEFEKFYDLCSPVAMDAFFKFMQSYIKKTENREVKIEQFNIFNSENNNVVRMFDTYHYTVYVPSNEAIDKAHQQGLPTWEELKTEYGVVTALESDSLPKLANDSVKAAALKEEIAMRKKGLKTGTDLILSFVKYHFQDNSVFVDEVPHVYKVQGAEPEYEVAYETSSLNAVTNKFSPVLVKTEENPGTAQKTISIRGEFSSQGAENKDFSNMDFNVCYVKSDNETEEHRLYNVMTRDIDYNKGDFVYTSSYAVVHQIVAGDSNGLGFLVNDAIYDAENNKFRR